MDGRYAESEQGYVFSLVPSLATPTLNLKLITLTERARTMEPLSFTALLEEMIPPATSEPLSLYI